MYVCTSSFRVFQRPPLFGLKDLTNLSSTESKQSCIITMCLHTESCTDRENPYDTL